MKEYPDQFLRVPKNPLINIWKCWIRKGFQGDPYQLCLHRTDGPARIFKTPTPFGQHGWYRDGKEFKHEK